MTLRLYEQDAYLRCCSGSVVAVTEFSDSSAVVLDQTVFYAMGGGQPGDSGVLVRADGTRLDVIDTRKGEGSVIYHMLAQGSARPEVGEVLQAELDWQRRHRHMRMHTCLHLLCALVDAPVTGGNLGSERGRLDFDLPQPTADKVDLTARLNALTCQDRPTSMRWIQETELDAQPELVKTLSVAPPRGAGKIRLIEIPGIDLQPCGGTHVRNLSEIGAVRVSKIQKKSRLNRRISVVFDDAGEDGSGG